MDQPFNIEAIQARRREIASEIERLTQEDKELEIAIRVADRFGKEASPASEVPKLGPPRPADAPPLIEMVNAVLKDAIAAGKPGLNSKELVAAIGHKFWPGVQSRQIMPPIYSFVSNERLKKGATGIFKPV